MPTFYNTIGLVELLTCGVKLGLPPGLLCMGLQMHTGPRILKKRNNLGEGVNVSTGILAGCMMSNSFPRAILYNMLQPIHDNHWPTTIQECVDDLAQRDEGTSQQVISRLGKDEVAVAKRLKECCCVLFSQVD